MESKLTFKQYYEALKKNKLLGLKCRQCGALTVPPKLTCGQCTNGDLDVVEVIGRGEVQTFTTIFVPPEGREAECPYTVVVVSLDEGPWIMGRLAGIEPEKVDMNIIGRKVKMGNVVFPGDKYSAGEGVYPVFNLDV